nr:RNA-directed DNA polymerase, eukaryota [Tanacetum cinerariifolium]
MTGKLKFLKYKIRKWIKDNRCNRKVAFDKLKEELRLVDEAIDKGVGTEEAKIKWSIEGDENSSFFHGMLNKKRNQSNIRGIMVDGVWKEQPNDIKQEFLNHFQEIFDKLVERQVTIDMSYPRSISGEQRDELEREVTIEDIKTAVWNCGTDKFPGPDGFTFDFYFQFWSTIDKDVYAAVNHFFINGDIPTGCNSSFLALILKVPDANLVKDFRPISLISSIYKIIAKILTNRLINVLEDIESEVQLAFVAGRQILDGLFILNEVLHWCSKKKQKSLIFKVDFEKAYDSVRWDFLDDVLKKFGFGGRGESEDSGLQVEIENIIHWRSIYLAEIYVRWFEGGILKDLFPQMFALEDMKEVTVSSKLNGDNLADSFSREFSVASIRRIINEMRFPNTGDSTRWVKLFRVPFVIMVWSHHITYSLDAI